MGLIRSQSLLFEVEVHRSGGGDRAHKDLRVGRLRAWFVDFVGDRRVVRNRSEHSRGRATHVRVFQRLVHGGRRHSQRQQLLAARDGRKRVHGLQLSSAAGSSQREQHLLDSDGPDDVRADDQQGRDIQLFRPDKLHPNIRRLDRGERRLSRGAVRGQRLWLLAGHKIHAVRVFGQLGRHHGDGPDELGIEGRDFCAQSGVVRRSRGLGRVGQLQNARRRSFVLIAAKSSGIGVVFFAKKRLMDACHFSAHQGPERFVLCASGFGLWLVVDEKNVSSGRFAFMQTAPSLEHKALRPSKYEFLRLACRPAAIAGDARSP